MLATRQGSLFLALLCAVIAAGILMFALGRYKSNLNTVPQQATVLVATGEIKKGTTGEEIAKQHLYKSTPVISSQLTSGAMANAASLASEVAQTDILPGQQLTNSQFSSSAGPPALLAPGQRAISVAIDEAHGDTDILRAGDHIDIYTTVSVGSGGNSGSLSQELVLLVPDALVLKPASGSAVHDNGRTISGGSMVLALSSKDVGEVAYAADSGKLWVSLRPSDASPTPSSPITLQSILAQHGLSTGGGS
jgi:pilus assembly protein CpaB